MEPYVSTSCLKGSNSRFTKNVFTVLRVYKKLGIKNVELGSAHSYIKDLSPLFKYKKDFKFTIHSVFPPTKEQFMMNLASNTIVKTKTIEAAKKAVELARKIDAPIYSLHSGYLCEIDDMGHSISAVSMSRETAEDNIVSSLIDICDFASQYNVRVAIENSSAEEAHQLFFTAKQYKGLLRKVNRPNLGLLIDLANLRIAGYRRRFDPKEYIKEVAGHIFEMHVAESTRTLDFLPLKDNTILQRFGISKKVCQMSAVALESHMLSQHGIMSSLSLLRESMNMLK